MFDVYAFKAGEEQIPLVAIHDTQMDTAVYIKTQQSLTHLKPYQLNKSPLLLTNSDRKPIATLKTLEEAKVLAQALNILTE